AAAVTAPSSGSVAGSGASAAGRATRPGRARSAARSSNAGMRMQAIMGTYVLHEHAFAVKSTAVGRIPAAESCAPEATSDHGYGVIVSAVAEIIVIDRAKVAGAPRRDNAAEAAAPRQRG